MYTRKRFHNTLQSEGQPKFGTLGQATLPFQDQACYSVYYGPISQVASLTFVAKAPKTKL